MTGRRVTKCRCGNKLKAKGRGRPPRHCSHACRQADYVHRRRLKGKRGGSRHGGMTQRRLNEWTFYTQKIPVGGIGPRVDHPIPPVGGFYLDDSSLQPSIDELEVSA